jgi:hypothetical protein
VKRISLVVLVVAASVVGVSAVAAASASAYTALCKTAPESHECGSSAYPAGTHVLATLKPGTKFKFESEAGTPIVSCANSRIDMTSKAAEYLGGQQLWVNEYTFGECEGGAVNVNNTSHSGSLKYLNYVGPHSGGFLSWDLMEIYPKDSNTWGNYCGEQIIGEGAELTPGSAPLLTFNKSYVQKSSTGSGGSFLCPDTLRATGTYVISTPTPLYLEPK